MMAPDALKQDDQEHPVPEPWRDVFRRIACAFAEGDYQLSRHRIEHVAPIDAATALWIADCVAAYGAALAPLDESTWERSCYRWMEDHWLVLVDLTTDQEMVSDLTLHAAVRTAPVPLIEVRSVHVP